LDHESRSRVCPKKKRRDQLSQRALVHPSWALGFGDEVWWSRLAQANQHGWTDAETSYQLIIFQAVRMMSKTCNQLAGLAILPPLDTTWGRA
jgi:hypothetical protein